MEGTNTLIINILRTRQVQLTSTSIKSIIQFFHTLFEDEKVKFQQYSKLNLSVLPHFADLT